MINAVLFDLWTWLYTPSLTQNCQCDDRRVNKLHSRQDSQTIAPAPLIIIIFISIVVIITIHAKADDYVYKVWTRRNIIS